MSILGSHQNVLQEVNGQINMVHPDNGIFIQCRKETNYKAMKGYGGTLNTYHPVKEASLYCSNSMTFWKKQNFADGKKIRGRQRLRGGRDKKVEQRGCLEH